MLFRKLIVLLVLFLCGTTYANGVAVWGLTEQSPDNRNNAITARVGYQYDFIEAFLGSTWRPNYDADTGEIKPPQVISLGAVAHMADVVDPNNPIPYIPELLLKLIPEDWVAQPYFGGQGTFNLLDRDSGFYGAIIGLKTKTDPESKAAFIVEAQFNDNFASLDAVPDNFRLNLGFRFYFN